MYFIATLFSALIPLLIIIVILVVLVALFKSGVLGKVSGLDLRGKTDEQKRIIKYFHATGILAFLFPITDFDFDTVLKKRVAEYNIFQMALKKIGLDAEEVREINPIFFDGYYSGGNAAKRLGKDMVYRTSKYQMSCLLFSSTQVYLYSFIFDLKSNETDVHTEEYFYKDVTSVTTDTNIIELRYVSGCLGIDVRRISVPLFSFKLVVPGDSFSCVMGEEAEYAIQGMKAKLREKKV
jgi:hypothetical protein